jgi:hypothetical protein
MSWAGLHPGRPGFDSRQGEEMAPAPAVASTQPPVQRVPRELHWLTLSWEVLQELIGCLHLRR